MQGPVGRSLAGEDSGGKVKKAAVDTALQSTRPAALLLCRTRACVSVCLCVLPACMSAPLVVGILGTEGVRSVVICRVGAGSRT